MKLIRPSRYSYARLGLYETLYIVDLPQHGHTWFLDPTHPMFKYFMSLSDFIKDS